MATVKKIENVISITGTTVDGKELLVHAVDTSGCFDVVLASKGGWLCTKITSLNQPTLDGAKISIEVKSAPVQGVAGIGIYRLKESGEEILAAFRDAGLENSQPKMVSESVPWRIGNQIGSGFHRLSQYLKKLGR